MNQEIIDSYRKHFEELQQTFENLEGLIKDEATKDVSAFMCENRFDESQAAVIYLKTLLEKIKFDINFDKIEGAIKEYNKDMELLRKNTEHINVSSLKLDRETTKQVSSDKVFNHNSTPNLTSSDSESFLTFVQKRLPNHNFKIVKVDNENIEVEKNKKHYYMTLVKPGLKKDDYFSVLERMNQKKNIGFICENEDNMQSVQQITNEWVSASPEYKTKFLTIHFTTRERLEQTENVFETFKF